MLFTLNILNWVNISLKSKLLISKISNKTTNKEKKKEKKRCKKLKISKRGV